MNSSFFALLSFDSTYEFSKSFMNYITILTCVLLNVRFLRIIFFNFALRILPCEIGKHVINYIDLYIITL